MVGVGVQVSSFQGLGVSALGIDFRVLVFGFGSGVFVSGSGFGFWISGSGFGQRVSGSRLTMRTSTFGGFSYAVSGFGFDSDHAFPLPAHVRHGFGFRVRVSGTQFRVSGFGFRV